PSKPVQADAIAPQAPARLEAERKNVTVLFADISGFTSMSEKLDPEDVTTVMNGALNVLANAVSKYEGYIDKFIGDCVMALFGAPITHENDPELAIRAALEMRRGLEHYNAGLPVRLEVPLTLHIGINSGVVIAGGMGSDQKLEYTVMGDTVNLASRLESNAGSGQIFVSSFTYNLTRELFEFTSHEPIKVKGKKDPVAVYEVTGERQARAASSARLEAAKLVGRTREMLMLRDCLDRFLAGTSQVVFLLSEAGIGKSRVHHEVKKHLGPGQVQIVDGVFRSYSRATTYSAFVEMFRHLLSIDADDQVTAVADKVVRNLPLLLGLDEHSRSDELSEATVFIGLMLGIDLSAEFDVPLAQMTPQERKAATFKVIPWVLDRLASRQPMLLVLEDAHYADRTSVEMIGHMFHALAKAPLFMLILLRPDTDSLATKLVPMARKSRPGAFTEITFSRLSNDESDQLVYNLLEATEVPAALLELVRRRAEGNPLYIAELIRELLEHEALALDDERAVRITRDLDSVALPSSIQGMIISRIDRLPLELKDLLQVASVIGPVFRRELLEQVCAGEQVDDRIDQLLELGLVFESQSYPYVEYSFRNLLTQEAVYSTLLHKKRRELHARVAEEVEALFAARFDDPVEIINADQMDDHIEVLAHHYEAADEPEPAYRYLARSGLKAQQAYANSEAADYYRRAIEKAWHMETPPTDLAQVHTSLSEVLELEGELEDAIGARRTAHELATEAGARAEALRHIGRMEEKRGFKDRSLEAYQAAKDLMTDAPESLEMGQILMNESWVLNRLKRFEDAVAEGERALAIFQKHADRENEGLVYNNLAVYHEHAGLLDRALDYNQRALERFRETGNKRQQANVLLSLGYLHNKRDEQEQALDCFDRSLEIMERIGNRYGIGTALMAKG
ncbi:MAG TPA: adenylate/guanylate cyclase domain-containing protein, partial [Gammaproteobacteria bacterium]